MVDRRNELKAIGLGGQDLSQLGRLGHEIGPNYIRRIALTNDAICSKSLCRDALIVELVLTFSRPERRISGYTLRCMNRASTH